MPRKTTLFAIASLVLPIAACANPPPPPQVARAPTVDRIIEREIIVQPPAEAELRSNVQREIVTRDLPGGGIEREIITRKRVVGPPADVFEEAAELPPLPPPLSERSRVVREETIITPGWVAPPR